MVLRLAPVHRTASATLIRPRSWHASSSCSESSGRLPSRMRSRSSLFLQLNLLPLQRVEEEQQPRRPIWLFGSDGLLGLAERAVVGVSLLVKTQPVCPIDNRRPDLRQVAFRLRYTRNMCRFHGFRRAL
jgi:hypothetical protein